MLAMSAGFRSAMRLTASDSVLVDAAGFANPRPLGIDALLGTVARVLAPHDLVTRDVGDGSGRAPPLDAGRLACHDQLVQEEHVFRKLDHDRRFRRRERYVHFYESRRGRR